MGVFKNNFVDDKIFIVNQDHQDLKDLQVQDLRKHLMETMMQKIKN